MGKNYTEFDGEKIRFSHNKLVNDFLSENPVVRCKKEYFAYDSATGIFNETELDEIQLSVARYYEKNTNKKWTVKVNREVIECLRINIPDVKEMEKYKSKICLANCVLDVKTRKIYKHSHKYLFLHRSNVEYNKSAECPLFEQFLDQITMHNQKRKEALVEFMGLCLTKEIGLGMAVILKGAGANGKSVFCNTLCALLGENNYTSVVLKDLPTFGSAKIPGKKLVIMSETSRATSSNVMSNELKQIASGEVMSCNQKYKPITDMKPFAKILLLTNHEIGFLEDDSEGALRRVYIIPFEHYIPPEQRDFHLEDKLKCELSGILNLSLEGYQRLVENGYMYSSKAESDAIINDVIRLSNPLRSFIRENIEYSAESRLSYAKIRKRFSEWCEVNDLSSQGNEGFSIDKMLDGRDIFKEISNYYNVTRYKSNGDRGLKNIRFKDIS